MTSVCENIKPLSCTETIFLRIKKSEILSNLVHIEKRASPKLDTKDSTKIEHSVQPVHAAKDSMSTNKNKKVPLSIGSRC